MPLPSSDSTDYSTEYSTEYPVDLSEVDNPDTSYSNEPHEPDTEDIRFANAYLLNLFSEALPSDINILNPFLRAHGYNLTYADYAAERATPSPDTETKEQLNDFISFLYNADFSKEFKSVIINANIREFAFAKNPISSSAETEHDGGRKKSNSKRKPKTNYKRKSRTNSKRKSRTNSKRKSRTNYKRKSRTNSKRKSKTSSKRKPRTNSKRKSRTKYGR